MTFLRRMSGTKGSANEQSTGKTCPSCGQSNPLQGKAGCSDQEHTSDGGEDTVQCCMDLDLDLARQPDSVKVTLSVFLDGKLQGSQVFSMPGPHKFWAVDCIVGVKAKEYFNLGPFNDEGAAHALADALNRLNTLLPR